MVLRIVEQESVVTVRRDDLGVGNATPVMDQRLHDLARARRGEAPVGRECSDQEFARRLRQRPRQITAVCAGRIEIIERLRDPQVRVGVVIIGELFALMAQVRLDLKFRRERKADTFAQLAAELRLHLLIG
jgi:hypothetical protein